MFKANEILAPAADFVSLNRAGRLFKDSFKKRLPDLGWVVRGSAELNDALAVRLIHELDLDCFLIVPRKSPASLYSDLIRELVFSVCADQQWLVEIKLTGYRIWIQDSPRLNLDIGILRINRSTTERLDRECQLVCPTDVLNPRLAHPQALADPTFHGIWLNLKLWAKTHLDWACRPSTHVLRSIALLHCWKDYRNRSQANWDNYIYWLKSLSEHLDSGDLLTQLGRLEKMARPMEETMDQFSKRLRSHVDALEHQTLEEHRHWIVSARSNKSIRVFVSSRQREFAKLRLNISKNGTNGIEFLVSEKFFPWHLKATNGIDVCEAAVANAEIFLGIYGDGYGVQSQGRYGSPIEEEMNYARGRIQAENILMFSLANAIPEPKLAQFLARNSDIEVRPLHEDIDHATRQVMFTLSHVASRKHLRRR